MPIPLQRLGAEYAQTYRQLEPGVVSMGSAVEIVARWPGRPFPGDSPDEGFFDVADTELYGYVARDSLDTTRSIALIELRNVDVPSIEGCDLVYFEIAAPFDDAHSIASRLSEDVDS